MKVRFSACLEPKSLFRGVPSLLGSWVVAVWGLLESEYKNSISRTYWLQETCQSLQWLRTRDHGFNLTASPLGS